MADVWSQPTQRRSGTPREFFISVEVYISNKAAAALRKPVPRKKVDKRESARPLSVLTDDNQRKVREKTSWLNLARGTNAGDHWRQATCRIAEEGEGCILNVYIEETILFQSVYLHLLNHTDIRHADRSLFFRRDCLGIHCASHQRWSATLTTEPLYFGFPSTESLNTWLALLRSYALPEVYGRTPSSEGGTYRIWRQVEVTCIQGRHINTLRPLGSENLTPNLPPPTDGESRNEGEAVDMDLFCEVYFNDVLSGRTVVKKSLGDPDWHETFLLTDLPPFERLAVLVWREKKLQRPPSIVGTVYITLPNFRRGEYVEGWFPILCGSSTTAGVQAGQIRLKLKVDEEIILPQSAYSRFMDTLDSRNYLEWMSDFDTKLKMKHLSSELVSVAVAKDMLVNSVLAQADREVDGTPTSHNTLFRGNTVLTKTVELLMGWYGKAFLEASVGSTIRRLCAENIAIEVDPLRDPLRSKSVKDIERNVETLVYWCQEIWNQIYSVRAKCPSDMRRLFERVRQLVEKRYKTKGTSDSSRDLPWQSVSAFCFLRFIVPAILHPHLFGLCPGLPDLPVQRSLTLIAKVIQSLANLNATVQKEEFMRGVKAFLEESLPAMFDYLSVVSTPEVLSATPQKSEELQTMHRAARVLRERKQSMQELHREAIPLLPHLLDIPRHLSVIASAIVRQCDDSGAPQDQALKTLYMRCSDFEQQALFRVSRVAASAYEAELQNMASSGESSAPSSYNNSRVEAAGPSSPTHSRRHSRPVTAPALHGSPRPREAISDPSLPTTSSAHARGFSNSQVDVSATVQSPASDASQDNGSWPIRRRLPPSHPRSISTDSIPVFRPSPSSGPSFLDSLQSSTEDTSRSKKGFFKGILRK
ncbi:Rho GTPase activation protein [Auriscalpium vulgare]|uniref:Rho GTPase activation protein n=1 Tax=Auriscalpium vulgare TaxID=40419 RepID=A0ACB8RVI6_9AGAM|nr:Rho GTPase activation protein [Auriscalpium vulgare]